MKKKLTLTKLPPGFLASPDATPGYMIAPVNDGFVQVSKIYIDEMNQLAHHAPSAHRVLWTLIKEMDKENAIMMSVDSLAKLTKFGTATVKRAVALLREQQWLEVLKIGNTNVYRVNAQLVWQDRPDGKWAAFNARLLVNFDEQDATAKRLAGQRTRHIPFVQKDDVSDPPSPPSPPATPGQMDLLDGEEPPY